MGMKNRFQEAIQNVQRQRHLARRSVAMVLVLAMLTAMSVSWRLHQDGIALAADDTRYYCGKEEHKHTDDCYIEGTEPLCGYEEGEIVEEAMDLADDAGDGDSSAADWDEAGSEPESEPATQEEPEPEVVLHHHTSDCYEEKEVLTCGIESDHVHQDYCYDQETGELLCTEHEHTDDCYTLEEVLVCGQEEGEPEKTDDGAALYDMDENSAEESDFAGESETAADPEPEKEATKPETDDEIDTDYTVHHHTAECYGKVLICGKEEHEHTAACLVNPNAEIDAEYDAKTPDRTDADWAEDMVLVAKSQLGYTESKADVDEDGNGYTMYADQYYKDKPMVYADWDSTFVAYCLYHAGVPQDIIPQYASISALRGELARMNSEYYTDDPQGFASILPGDIVMYKNAEGRETIGVVSDAAVDEETDLTTALTVISGDVATGCESDGETTIDQVAEVEVALNDVTSFVSVNGAEGYGISDLMEEDEEAKNVDSNVIDLVDKNKELNTAAFNSFEVTAQWKSGKTDNDWTDVTEDHVFKEGDSIRVNGTLSLKPDSFIDKDGKTLCDTIVWDSGLKLAKALDDGVLTDPERNPVGTLKVTENGVATIHFKDLKAFNLEKPVEFWFTALATCSGEDLEQKITFPGTGTTVTVKKNTDIHAKKELLTENIRYDEKGNPYLEYRVTVSSEKGTAGTVNIVDQIADKKNLYGTYSDFALKKYSNGADETGESIDVNPKITNPASGAPTGAETQFEINNLAALKAGERYKLTYRYQLSRDLCTDKKLSGWIGNNVTATDNGNGKTSSDPTSNKFLDRIEKSSNYDSVTRKVTWTITVRNPGKQNLSKYDVTDEIRNSAAKIDKNTVKLYGGDKEDACKKEIPGGTLKMATGDQGFTYTFPTINAGDVKPYYKIVYQSDAPNGETSIQNDVTIEDQDGKDKDSTTANGNIQESGSFFKGKGNHTLQDVGNGLQKATWYITALIPRDKRTTELTISDTFQQVTYGNGKIAEHYALLGELFDQLNNKTDQKGAMEVYLDNDGATYRPQHWNGVNNYKLITVTYKFHTADGDDIEIDSAQDAPAADVKQKKVTGFSVTVKSEESIRKVNIGHTNYGDIGYTTYVDVSDVPEDVSCSIKNEASSPIFSNKPSQEYPYKKDKAPEEKEEIVKQVSYDAGQNYTNAPSKEYDYATAQQEGIFYKISLKPAKGRNEITVVDTLPDGLVYDPAHKCSAAQAVFSKKSPSSGTVTDNGTIDDTLGSKIYWKEDGTPVYGGDNQDGLKSFDLTDPKNFTVTQSADGKTLTFTIKNLNQIPDKVKESYQTIGIFYALQLTQDTWENRLESSKVYQNTASWTGVGDASAKITVKRGDTHLEKTVVQNSNGKLTYTVEINPKGLELNPRSTDITLYDTFTVNKRGTATLDRSSIKLYDHKENQDTKDYTLTTSEEKGNGNSEVTNYNMILRVQDGRPYTFTYTYLVDRSQVNSDADVTAKNKARITAVWQEASDEKITSSAGGGSVGSKDGELTLYKVDKNSENKVLKGAVFALTAYDKESGSWNTAQVTASTDENGKITFVPIEGTNEASKVYVSADTLYKLVETKAPNGYVLDAKPLYFIWMQDDASEPAKQKEAYKAATGKTRETDAADPDVANYKSVTYFQTGHSYERKFTNAPKQLELQKVWADEDGKIMSSPPDGVTGIQLNVYQYTEAVFNKNTATLVQTVKLNTGNDWREKLLLTDSNENTRYYVEEVDVPDGYKVTYKNRAGEQTQLGYADGDKVTVTNQKRPTELTVYKNWRDQNGTLTSSTVAQISVTLHGKPKEGMAGGETTDTVKLTAERGWKHVFEGLDPDYLYTVEESPIPGFTVSYSYPEGSSDVAPGGTVTITNTEAPTYELPSTGSPGGTVPYTAGGAAIALAAVLCGYNSRRKRKRGEE